MVFRRRLREKREEKKGMEETESVIIALIRSKNGTTLDDIIITAHITAEEADKQVKALMARNVIKIEQREGRTYYVVA